MANQKPDNENEVTPKGAVEIKESDLDQAAGGMSSGGDYSETVATGQGSGAGLADKAGQTSAPADPSIGLLKDDPQKKI